MKKKNKVQLSKKAISDFKKVYFDEFGVELSDGGANKKGLELLTFIKLIYEPIPLSDQLPQ